MAKQPIKGAYNVTLQVTVQIVPDEDDFMSPYEAAEMAHMFAGDAMVSEEPKLRVLFVRAYEPVLVMVPQTRYWDGS